MTSRWTSPRTGSVVYEADARTIAADVVAPGSCSLAILDGPYGYGYGAWDRIPRGGTLADLYHGHLDDVGRVCAASASLYLWNTSAGWAELHPLIVARGWTFRSLIVWDKGQTGSKALFGTATIREWPDVTEVCGFYQRHDFPRRIRDMRADRTYSEVAHLVGCDSRLPALWEGWPNVHGSCLPTISQWEKLGGTRTEYACSVATFTCPVGVGNIWTHGQVAGSDRLKAPNGETLHPCQKPLLFAERMIRASSRPGDLVWAPFGGTLRELIAAERIAMLDPAEARRVITCELNQDGKDYIGAALAQIDGSMARPAGQIGLFARTTGDRT